MILITGATGTNGLELIKLLSARRMPARAMVRSAASAKAIADPPGIEPVIGDFDDPASIERVLDGVEQAFLLTNSSERAQAQQIGFVEQARTRWRQAHRQAVAIRRRRELASSLSALPRGSGARHRDLRHGLHLPAAQPLHAGAPGVSRYHPIARSILCGCGRWKGERGGRPGQRRCGRRCSDRAWPRREGLRPYRPGKR